MISSSSLQAQGLDELLSCEGLRELTCTEQNRLKMGSEHQCHNRYSTVEQVSQGVEKANYSIK